jgi:thiol-disulfide isomerase/thioredoxin
MKNTVILFLLVCAASFSYGQTAEVIKFDQLEKLIHQKNDKVTVINFWATWCGPCVKEMPYFEALGEKYKGQLEVSFISVDFMSKEAVVNKFITKKGLKSDVYLLNETDANSWIDRVDPSWSGAIPATLIINSSSKKRKFIEGELTFDELETHLKTFIN